MSIAPEAPTALTIHDVAFPDSHRPKQGLSDQIAGVAAQAVIANRGEWVRYSTPFPGGAEYIAICLPAFSPETVHRDR